MATRSHGEGAGARRSQLVSRLPESAQAQCCPSAPPSNPHGPCACCLSCRPEGWPSGLAKMCTVSCGWAAGPRA